MFAPPASPSLGLGGDECVSELASFLFDDVNAGGQTPQMPGADPVASPAPNLWAQSLPASQDPSDVGGWNDFGPSGQRWALSLCQGLLSDDDFQAPDVPDETEGYHPHKKQRLLSEQQMGVQEAGPSQPQAFEAPLEFPELPSSPEQPHAVEAGVPSPAPTHAEPPAQPQPGAYTPTMGVPQPGAYTPTMVQVFPTWQTAQDKVRALLGNPNFELNRDTCKALQQDPVMAVRVWKAVHAGLQAHERDLLLDEMEYMDIQAHHGANSSKNVWRNQFNYVCHFVRWIAAYAILRGVTVEEAAREIEDLDDRYDERDGIALLFENWKSKAASVLPPGSLMRRAWDKAGKGSDVRTRKRLEMIAAGCIVYVAL